jgi:hypothetical protein
MKRFLIVAAVGLALETLVGGTALAGTKWCVEDPIISVNNKTSDVTVQFDATYEPTVTGPVTFIFHVPSNATASVTTPPATLPYTVQVLYDLPAGPRHSTTITVDTLVPASTSFSVQTTVNATKRVLVGVAGTSNVTTSVTYTIGN